MIMSEKETRALIKKISDNALTKAINKAESMDEELIIISLKVSDLGKKLVKGIIVCNLNNMKITIAEILKNETIIADIDNIVSLTNNYCKKTTEIKELIIEYVKIMEKEFKDSTDSTAFVFSHCNINGAHQLTKIEERIKCYKEKYI